MAPKNGTYCRAVTLTTGIQPSTHNIEIVWDKLYTYLSYLGRDVKYYFELEIFDDDALLTKIHFHGTLKYNKKDNITISKFIKKWEMHMGYTKIKPLNNVVIWDIYCKKQYLMYKMMYPYKPKHISNATYKNRGLYKQDDKWIKDWDYYTDSTGKKKPKASTAEPRVEDEDHPSSS